MTKKILLINPAIYDFAAYDLFSKPLGLLCLATQLRKSGFEVGLVDTLDRGRFTEEMGAGKLVSKGNGTGKYLQEEVEKPSCLGHVPRIYRRYGLPVEHFREALGKYAGENRPLAVMVTSMMTYWYPGVAEAIRLVREVLGGDVPIGLGGVYASLMPDHAERVCGADRVFVGSDFGQVQRWLVELTGQETNGAVDAVDEDEFVLPAYDLYDRLNYLTVLGSVGCPYNCDYCASRVVQKRFRQCPVDLFMEQLTGNLARVTKRGGYYNVAFMDDALLARAEKHIVPILEKTAALRDDLRFHCPNGIHARFITERVAELMRANNFRMLRLSYEGASSTSLAQQASDEKVSDAIFSRAVGCLERGGFARSELEAYILTGLPGQTMEEIEQSAAAVHGEGLKVRICQYTPIAGTKLFGQACMEYGIDPDEPLLHNNSTLPILAGQYGYAAFKEFKDWVNGLNASL